MYESLCNQRFGNLVSPWIVPSKVRQSGRDNVEPDDAVMLTSQIAARGACARARVHRA